MRRSESIFGGSLAGPLHYLPLEGVGSGVLGFSTKRIGGGDICMAGTAENTGFGRRDLPKASFTLVNIKKATHYSAIATQLSLSRQSPPPRK